MSQNFEEPVVYQCKIHRGTFLLPLLLTAALILPGLKDYVSLRDYTHEASVAGRNFAMQATQIIAKTGLLTQQQVDQQSAQNNAEFNNYEDIYKQALNRQILHDVEWAIVPGFIFFCIVLAAYLRSSFVLTRSKLHFSTGLFSYSKAEVLLSKIEGLTLVNPLLGRMFGYGTVVITGTGGTVFRVSYLPKAEYFYGLLQETRVGAASVPAQSVQELTKNLEDMHTRYMPK